MYRVRSVFVLLFFFSLFACGGGGGGAPASDGDGGGDAPGDAPGDITKTGSHNAGQDCIGCHKTGGVAESAGVFNAAGTIYKSNGSAQTDATVNLYISGTNTLVASLTTDGSGNFYTEALVDGLFYGNGFVSGVEIEVQGPGGLRTMPGTITSASCGVCHGSGKVKGNVIAN